MSAYNFKKRYENRIVIGVKRSTIRFRRKNGYLPKAGERIRLYVGMRSSGCRLLREVDVSNVRPIVLDPMNGVLHVELDGRRLPSDELRDLARQEGFDSIEDMRLSFAGMYGGAINAYLIEWAL